MIGYIKTVCYTVEIHTLTDDRATGVMHRHVNGSENRSRKFSVKVKNGVFRCTTISGPSGSDSEHFHVKNMVKCG